MKYTILVATTLTEDATALMRAAKDIEIISTGPDPKLVRKHIANADALIIRDDLNVDAQLLADGKRLRAIGRAGVGLAGIDVEAATTRGVIVMNTPGANSIAAGAKTTPAMLGLCGQTVPPPAPC